MRCQFGISRSARRPRFPLPGRPPHPRRPSLSPSGVRRAEEGYRFAGASSGRGNLLRAPAELSRPAVAKAIAAALGRRAEQSRELEWRRRRPTLASRRVQAPRPGRAMPGTARPAPPMSHAGHAVRRRLGQASLKRVGAGGIEGNALRDTTAEETSVANPSLPPAATCVMEFGRKVAGGRHDQRHTLLAPAATRLIARAAETLLNSDRGALRFSPLRGPQLRRCPSFCARGSARLGKWGRGGLGAGRGENRAGATLCPAARRYARSISRGVGVLKRARRSRCRGRRTGLQCNGCDTRRVQRNQSRWAADDDAWGGRFNLRAH